MQKAGVKCIDCHMPKIGKSAVGNATKYQGDVREHIFKINTDVNAKMFSDDGKTANGYLTLDWTCLNCHNDKDKAWAGQYTNDLHKFAKASTLSPEPVETKSPGFEVFIGIMAMMAALFVRRR
jgi:formate-dependent nitrite reductase cytochrome c552 subunit